MVIDLGIVHAERCEQFAQAHIFFGHFPRSCLDLYSHFDTIAFELSETFLQVLGVRIPPRTGTTLILTVTLDCCGLKSEF